MMYKTERIIKDNGLQVTSSIMPHMHSAAIVIGIRAGSVYENQDQRGISHFIEHMLFKGTSKRKNTLEISQCIEQLGGEINASTSEECTFLYCKILHKNFSDAFEVMIDILNDSLFKKEDINHEKAVVIEEINKYKDIPEDWIGFLINQLLWKNSILGQNVLGEKKTIRRFDRDAIFQYYRERYQPKNMVISITGNVPSEAVRDMTEALPFVEDKVKEKETDLDVQSKEQEAPEMRLLPRKINQAHLSFAFETFSRFHPDKITLDLLNILLGAGLSSRLFQEVRVKGGLAYDIHSYTQYFDQTGSFNIYAGVDPDKLQRSIVTILGELVKVKNDEISGKELQKAKEMYKGSILLGLESTLNYAFSTGTYLLLLNKEYQYQELIDKIDRIKMDDIRGLAQKIFMSHRINLVVLYPNHIKISKSRIYSLLKL
ncbi:MAG: insulinase family protein [Candidatus Atribacteria bacterium]|nr:insulinase family protein [Candidatus Atribacteria bacterium]